MKGPATFAERLVTRSQTRRRKEKQVKTRAAKKAPRETRQPRHDKRKPKQKMSKNAMWRQDLIDDDEATIVGVEGPEALDMVAER